ncbi:MAG: hypothetical protein EP347_07870 [Alphaproteobacteria bacterium]|nr:MAG: hypothetical protein EP347_07870 [Alphaproteobacteria bacterium]
MPLKPYAIDHLQVTVPPDMETVSIAFYEGVLGLKRIEKPEPLRARGGAWFQLGDLQVHLSIEPDPQASRSKRHICYLVQDLAAARASLKAELVQIEDEGTEPNGLKRFFIRDPAGNKIEIAERPA